MYPVRLPVIEFVIISIIVASRFLSRGLEVQIIPRIGLFVGNNCTKDLPVKKLIVARALRCQKWKSLAKLPNSRLVLVEI